MSDRFLIAYISSLKAAIQALKDDVITTNFGGSAGLYSLGTLQGRATGLEEALSLLNNALEAQDI